MECEIETEQKGGLKGHLYTPISYLLETDMIAARVYWQWQRKVPTTPDRSTQIATPDMDALLTASELETAR